MYPLVMAASQCAVLSPTTESFISRTIGERASERNRYLYDEILRVVKGFWRGENKKIGDTAWEDGG